MSNLDKVVEKKHHKLIPDRERNKYIVCAEVFKLIVNSLKHNNNYNAIIKLKVLSVKTYFLYLVLLVFPNKVLYCLFGV